MSLATPPSPLSLGFCLRGWTNSSLPAQVHQRWAWRGGGVAARVLPGAESPQSSLTDERRAAGGAGSAFLTAKQTQKTEERRVRT